MKSESCVLIGYPSGGPSIIIIIIIIIIITTIIIIYIHEILNLKA